MGRKAKPTRLKVLEGNPGKQKLPKNEPAPRISKDIPDPPCHLDDIAVEEWHRVAEGLHALGLLTDVDTTALAAYCDSYSQWVQANIGIKEAKASDPKLHGLLEYTTNGNLIQNQYVGIARRAKQDMVKYAGEFGMTPSKRSGLGVSDSGLKPSRFKGLIGGK